MSIGEHLIENEDHLLPKVIHNVAVQRRREVQHLYTEYREGCM